MIGPEERVGRMPAEITSLGVYCHPPLGWSTEGGRLIRTGHCAQVTARREPFIMIILGIILLIAGLLLKISILWTIGIILVVIGAILAIVGSTGRAIGGRRHYF